MSHTFALLDAGSQILFECSACSRQIAFARMGEGEPHAYYDSETQLWYPPENAGDYLSSCDIPVDPVAPVPASISKRQFLIQLLRSGMVTAEEVPLLAVKPPAAVTSVLAGLSQGASFEVTLTWAAMTEVLRHDALIDLAVGAGLMTSEQLDAFFIAAAEI